MKTAEILVANGEKGPIFAEHIASYFKEHLVYKNNRLLDELTAMRVEQFYKRFQAKVYYISASGRHGHPHETLLNGLIQAAVAQRNECTILLSTGNVLNSRKLPNPNKWKDYVTFKYLKEQGYASIDPITGNVDDAREYVPQLGDRNTRKCVREEINGGSAVDFFKKRVDKRMQPAKSKILQQESLTLTFSLSMPVQCLNYKKRKQLLTLPFLPLKMMLGFLSPTTVIALGAMLSV